MRRRPASAWWLLLVAVGCSDPRPAEPPRPAVPRRLIPPWPQTPPPKQPPRAELIESVPVETDLGFDTIVDTHEAWLDLVRSAKAEIAIGQFYATATPDGGGRLTPIVKALADAVARGVKVRILLDDLFADQNATTLERLAATGAEVRRTRVWKAAGGVQHAKYLVVDRARLYVGSANFDWRSLEHIHELGLRADDEALGGALAHVFDRDWDAAGGTTPPRLDPAIVAGGASVGPDGALHLTLSPGEGLPPEHHELQVLTELIGQARASLRVQVLDYDAAYRDGRPWPVLQDALLGAAARGVKVQLLVSDWQGGDEVEVLRVLERAEGIEVARIAVAEASTGFIPFARVAHAKYAVADGADAWVGSSNWKADYFLSGRNVGVHVRGGPIPGRLEAIHARLWARADRLDPTREYPEKRIR